MQDRAPSYIVGVTKAKLRERGIITIYWPLYLPDLNLIKTIQNQIKGWIKERYGDINHSYDKLRQYVKEAWEAITEEQLNSLIDSMRERCEAVISS